MAPSLNTTRPHNPKDRDLNIHLHENFKPLSLCSFLKVSETWSLTLREERGLRGFENRVWRRIFGPKREEDGSWRKLHNDELHDRILLG
jgi:hypothetical protein